MNPNIFGESSRYQQRSPTDRFVFPRSSMVESRCRQQLLNAQCPTGVSSIEVKDGTFASNLRKAFEIDTLIGKNKQKGSSTIDSVQLWPCKPREKIHLTSPKDTRITMNYGYGLVTQQIDWFGNELLVIASEKNYWFYDCTKRERIEARLPHDNIFCCQVDPKGELLALSTINGIEIDDLISENLSFVNRCSCSRGCLTTAIGWSPTGESFIACCYNGKIRGVTRSNENMKTYHSKLCGIQILQISPDARYVAASCIPDFQVLVLTWPELSLYRTLKFDTFVTLVTWHPWRTALLAIGTSSNSLNENESIHFWDGHPNVIRDNCDIPCHLSTDTLHFSLRTGEMVLGLSLKNKPDHGSRILVMKTPKEIVDYQYHWDRIHSMIFSPDGNKFASVSSKQKLDIWEFLPGGGNKPLEMKNFFAMPVALDELEGNITHR